MSTVIVRTVSNDTALVLSLRFASIGVGLAVQGALAWWLTPNGRGAFGVCLAFAGAASVVFSFGTDRAIQYLVTAKKVTVPTGVKLTLLGTALGVLFAIPLGWFSVTLPFAFFSRAGAEEFRLALLLIPLLMLVTRFQFLLGALHQFRLAGTALLVGSVLNGALIVLLVGALGLGVKGAIFAAFASQTFVAFTCWRGAHRLGQSSEGHITRSILSKLRTYSLKAYPARLGVFANVHLPVFIIATLASAHEVGLFIVASALVERVHLVPNSLSSVIQPRIGSSITGHPELVARSSRLLVMVASPLLLCIALPSQRYVPFLFSPAFLECVPVIWIMAIGVLIRGVTRPMEMYFLGSGRPIYASYGTVLQVLSTSCAVPILYSHFALPGAAFGVVIGQAVEALTLSIAFGALTGKSCRETFVPAKPDWDLCRNFLRERLARLRSD